LNVLSRSGICATQHLATGHNGRSLRQICRRKLRVQRANRLSVMRSTTSRWHSFFVVSRVSRCPLENLLRSQACGSSLIELTFSISWLVGTTVPLGRRTGAFLYGRRGLLETHCIAISWILVFGGLSMNLLHLCVDLSLGLLSIHTLRHKHIHQEHLLLIWSDTCLIFLIHFLDTLVLKWQLSGWCSPLGLFFAKAGGHFWLRWKLRVSLCLSRLLLIRGSSLRSCWIDWDILRVVYLLLSFESFLIWACRPRLKWIIDYEGRLINIHVSTTIRWLWLSSLVCRCLNLLLALINSFLRMLKSSWRLLIRVVPKLLLRALWLLSLSFLVFC
jgi:hypothetical protein